MHTHYTCLHNCTNVYHCTFAAVNWCPTQNLFEIFLHVKKNKYSIHYYAIIQAHRLPSKKCVQLLTGDRPPRWRQLETAPPQMTGGRESIQPEGTNLNHKVIYVS